MCSNHLYIPYSQIYRIGFAQLHIYGHFTSNNGVTNKLNKKILLGRWDIHTKVYYGRGKIGQNAFGR